MHQDNKNNFRPIFEDSFPGFTQRVESPWDNVPDLKSYNSDAHKIIKRELTRLKKQSGSQSQGVLILGEAGTGKTHQIMRLAQELCETNQILFVRKPTDEETVSQHIWLNIIRSLSRKLPVRNGKVRSQLEDLLAHVFSPVLIDLFQRYISEGKDVKKNQKFIKALKDDPYKLFSLLGKGKTRAHNSRIIINKTLNFLVDHHPEINKQIANVLLLYCFSNDEEQKRALKSWLEGNDLSVKEAKQFGLPQSWIEFDESFSQSVYLKQREDFAQQAIHTLGILSTYYNPLILVFDQLEALRGDDVLTRKWGHALLDIFNRTPNIFVITCIFPSLWKTWFQNELDESTQDRISNKIIKLDRFDFGDAEQLLEHHLDNFVTEAKLPEKIYPFESKDIEEICRKSNSPRAFLKNATEYLEYWLDEKEPVGSGDDFGPEPELLSPEEFQKRLQDELDKFIHEQEKYYEEDSPSENDFFGRIKNILTHTMNQNGNPQWIDSATCGSKVMPPNMIVHPPGKENSVCIAVMNGTGNGFSARIKNLRSVYDEQKQFNQLIIVRDDRCKKLGNKSQKVLNEMGVSGTQRFLVDKYEATLVNAFYDMLVAVEEHDIIVDENEVKIPDYLNFLEVSENLLKSNILNELFKQILPNSQESNGTFPGENDLPEGSTEPVGQPKKPARLTSAIATTPTVITEVTIGLKKANSPYKGRLGNLQINQRPISISLNKPQGIAVMGYMGSGKSYALGVLIENALLSVPKLIEQQKPLSVVAFNYRQNPDARFEYSGFGVANNNEKEIDKLKEKYGVDPKAVEVVNVLGHEKELKMRGGQYDGLPTYPIQFRSDELRAEQWEILMKPPSQQSEYMNIIRNIIGTLYYDENLTLANLEQQIMDDDRFTSGQRNRAMNRLSFAKQWINDDRKYEWSDIFKPGAFNIFDLRMQTMEASDALSLCLVLTDIVRRTKNGVNKMIVFDEAHEYMDSKILVKDLENCLTQIRHDGLSFVVATQFPERIPESIFKYLLTRVIFKIPSKKAINHLKKAAPNLEALSSKEISNLGLEQGVCYLQTDEDCTDDILRTPQLIEVRPRCTLHGGATIRNN